MSELTKEMPLSLGGDLGGRAKGTTRLVPQDDGGPTTTGPLAGHGANQGPELPGRSPGQVGGSILQLTAQPNLPVNNNGGTDLNSGELSDPLGERHP